MSRAAAFARIVTPSASGSAATTSDPRITRPPAARSASVRMRSTRSPGTDGGTVGISKTGRPSRSCSSLQTVWAWRSPSTAGNPTRSPAFSRTASCAASMERTSGRSSARASATVLTSTRSNSTSSSTARADTPARCRLSASSAAWKSLSWRRPTTTMGSSRRRSPSAIVTGTSAEGRQAPIGAGEQDVALEAAGVRIDVGHEVREPRERLADRSLAGAGVRVVGVVGQEAAERRRRGLDPLRRVAQDVERQRRQVRGARALGEDEHLLAATGRRGPRW